MFENVKADFYRAGKKKLTPFSFIIRCLGNAGFRAVVFYRTGNWCRKRRLRGLAIICERLMHHLCHCWISTRAEIGKGFLVTHVCSLIVGEGVVLGENCHLRQNITLGGNYNKEDENGRQYPIVGDNVSFGVGAVVTGPLKIGSNSIIGANAVVTKDVPQGVIVGGVPAKVLKNVWNKNTGRKL